MSNRNTWASITAADFAQDGWFNTPAVHEIHPAFRKEPTIASPADYSDNLDLDFLNSLITMVDYSIEGGGGEKVMVPIFYDGADLSNIYQQPNHEVWDVKPSPRTTPIRPPVPGLKVTSPTIKKYGMFPSVPQSLPYADRDTYRVEPLRLRGRRQSRSGQKRETSRGREPSRTKDGGNDAKLHFPMPPTETASVSSLDETVDSPIDPAFPSRRKSPPKIPATPALTEDSRSQAHTSLPPSTAEQHRNSASSDASAPSLAASSDHSNGHSQSRWSIDSSVISPTSPIRSAPESRFHMRGLRPIHKLSTDATPKTITTSNTSPSTPSSANSSTPHRKLGGLHISNPFKSIGGINKAPNPIIECAKTGDYATILRLFTPGTSTNGTSLLPPIDATDKNGFTALHWACKTGHTSIARALIARHASLSSVTKQDRRQPLFFAAAGGHTDIVALLIEAGADINAASSMDGATATHVAAQRGHEIVLLQLLDAGADQRRDVEGLTPLLWATQSGQLASARALAVHGANLEARIRGGANLELAPREGLTVLHKAVRSGNHALARTFVDLGADVNADGPNGMKPLHQAAAKGDLAMAALLIENGAEIEGVTDEGWSALHVAARHGHGNMCKLLVKSGADEGRWTKGGLTARELARGMGRGDLF